MITLNHKVSHEVTGFWRKLGELLGVIEEVGGSPYRWKWLDTQQNTRPMGPVDNGAVEWMGCTCTTYDRNQRRRGSQRQLKEEKRTCYPQMSHMSSTKKSMTSQACWLRHSKRSHHPQLKGWCQEHQPMTYQWNKGKEDLIKTKTKTKNLFRIFSNIKNL